MQSLVTRIKNGDQAAFRELYELFAMPMYNVCLRITNHEEDANDVLQDVFVKVFQNIDKLEEAQTLPAWIKRISVNTALQAIKKKKYVNFNEAIDSIDVENLSDLNQEIDEQDHQERIKAVQDAVSALPDKYRIVFTLHVMEEYSLEDIAKMLGIVASTTRSQYLRARIKLSELLKKNKSHVRSFEGVYTTA